RTSEEITPFHKEISFFNCNFSGPTRSWVRRESISRLRLGCDSARRWSCRSFRGTYHCMNRVSVLIAAIVVLPAFGRSEPVCASCHPNETRRFLSSVMGASLGPPSRVEGGRVSHQRSASSIAIESLAGDRMVHHLSAQGLTASYEIAYQIGAGKLAHSYIVEIKGYLFESPATW